MEDKILVKITIMDNDNEVCTFSVSGIWQEKDLIKRAIFEIAKKMGDDVNGYYRVVITSGEKMLLRYVNIDDYKPVVMGVIDIGLDDIKDLVSESKDLKDAKDAKNALENLLNIYHKFNDTLDKYIAMKEIQEKLEKLVKGEMKI